MSEKYSDEMALELTLALIEPTKGTVTYPREGASAGLSCCLKLTPSMKNVVRLNWANIAIGAIPNNRVARTFSFLFGVVVMFIYCEELGYLSFVIVLQRYNFFYV